MPSDPLTVNMKTTVLLVLAVFANFLAIAIASVYNGMFDIYALASLAVLVPYGVLGWLAWRRRPFAFLGIAVVSFVLIIATTMTIGPQVSPLDVWLTTLTTILFAFLTVEGTKSYLETNS